MMLNLKINSSVMVSVIGGIMIVYGIVNPTTFVSRDINGYYFIVIGSFVSALGIIFSQIDLTQKT